jgi:outer membrane protein assembly factor BamB
MRTDGQLIKVLDLGLADVDESFRRVQQSTLVASADMATQEQGAEHLTEFGAVLGTASYMAPEQTRDAASADNRSDIYSLGCTLYYLLIGEPPYKAETSLQVLAQHRESAIPPIRIGRPDVPQSVDDICFRMLAKEPKDRFQSMSELITAIEHCGVDLESNKLHHSAKRPFPRSGHGDKRSHRDTKQSRVNRSITFSALLATLVGGGYWLTAPFTRDDDRSSEAPLDYSPRVAPPRAANWRHLRYGPERTSFNPYEREIGPSNVNRLDVRWKNRHRSTIRGTVCVVEDIAYYGDYRGEFRAVEVATGKTIWTKKLDGKHQGHAIVDQVAYVTSINRLFAFDASTGRTLWTRVPPSGQFGGLLVVDEICYVGTNSPPTLHALTITGDELWNVPGGSIASTGKEIWNVTGGSIAISDGMIYKSLERTLQALDTTNGATQWQTTVPEGRLTGPAVSDGYVYVNSSAGKIYAYDVTDRKAQDRSPIWIGEMPVQVEGDGTQMPAVGHGKVFVGANDRFYAFDAHPGGSSERLPIWETEVEAPFFAALAPAIANGVVYSAAGNHDLYAFDAESGEVLWNFHTRGSEYPMRSTPTIANGQLYHAATFDFTLYAFNLPKNAK